MDYQQYLRNTGRYEEHPIKETPKEPTKEIDWEQRRYEIAKDVFCTFIREQYPCNPNNVVKDTITYTDELIEELKKTDK